MFIVVTPLRHADEMVRAGGTSSGGCRFISDRMSVYGTYVLLENISSTVIPGEQRRDSVDAREGDPGGESGLNLSAWVPFPSRRFAALSRG
jgi:hypothetical protein